MARRLIATASSHLAWSARRRAYGVKHDVATGDRARQSRSAAAAAASSPSSTSIAACTARVMTKPGSIRAARAHAAFALSRSCR